MYTRSDLHATKSKGANPKRPLICSDHVASNEAVKVKKQAEPVSRYDAGQVQYLLGSKAMPLLLLFVGRPCSHMVCSGEGGVRCKKLKTLTETQKPVAVLLVAATT